MDPHGKGEAQHIMGSGGGAPAGPKGRAPGQRIRGEAGRYLHSSVSGKKFSFFGEGGERK